MAAFRCVPAVVAAFDDDIDFLPFVLADVPDPEFAGFTVEREAPRIAESIGENFGPLVAGGVGKRIAGRNAVVEVIGWVVDIDAEDRTEQGRRVLPVSIGIATRSAIT